MGVDLFPSCVDIHGIVSTHVETASSEADCEYPLDSFALIMYLILDQENQFMNKEKADMIIYTTEDGLTKVETTFDGDTVWLSMDQMAELFQRDRSVIGKHVRNIFREGELEKESVWAKFAYTATDGKVYNVDYYNLDVIISVGYRVRSKRGTQFRIWATGILKEYMRKGFALDDDRLRLQYLII